jgi:DNA-binding MarR family transcriptional regulator
VTEDRDPFDDLASLRIDPADPKLRPKSAPAKKAWRRQFIQFPWAWMDQLKATNRGSTYRLALLLVYEHWRTGGRTIVLSNAMVEREGIAQKTKWNALRELEQMGLVIVERRPRKSPRVSLRRTNHGNDLAT